MLVNALIDQYRWFHAVIFIDHKRSGSSDETISVAWSKTRRCFQLALGCACAAPASSAMVSLRAMR